MRDAATRIMWSKLYEKNFPKFLAMFRVAGFKNISALRFDFNGGVTAVCGANGVGKTTVLRALRLYLENDLDKISERLRQGRLVGIHNDRANLNFFKIDVEQKIISGTRHDESVSWLDPGEASGRCLRLLIDNTNVENLIESSEPRQATADEIDQTNYVLGRDYDRILTYEIDDLDDEEGPVPYFSVREAGQEYGSLGMGMGELAVHYCLWILRRVKARSILLIEEPETFIAPFSQIRLLNVIAATAAARSVWTIIVTHSPLLLKAVPLEHIRFLTRLKGEVSVKTPDSFEELSKSLGVESPVRALVFVEDRRAGDLLHYLLRKIRFPYINEIEVVIAGGESNISNILRSLSNAPEGVTLVGVFDGDQRHIEIVTPCKVAFLPGNSPPETLLKELTIANVGKVADALSKTVNDLSFALASLQGIDAHDWFTSLSEWAHVTPAQLMSHIGFLVFEDSTTASQIDQLAKILLAALN